MADGTGPGRVTASGVAFAVLLLVLIVVSLYLFIAKPYWFPPVASVHGSNIDSLFGAVLLVSGIAFVIVQGMLGYFVARYGGNGGERASYWHDNPKAEAVLLIVTAVILTVLVFMGQRVWADVYFSEAPADAMVIQVTGQQFAWTFHYPGADGAFGRTDLKLITDVNSIGLDRSDAAAKDDVVTENDLHFPTNRAVKLRLRSKDVIHSLFLPNLRFKQDAVPGMSIEIWFQPNQPGTYEIACAELCGIAHYRMKAALTIDDSQAAFDQWFAERLKEQQQ